MNKNFNIGIIVVLVVQILCGCAQRAENEFILKGDIANYPGEKIYFCEGSITGTLITDSTTVKDGKFEYRGIAEEPKMLTISDRVVSMDKYDPDTKGINIYIEPAVMKLSMEWFAPEENMQNTRKEYTLEGSATEDESRILNKMMQEAKDKFIDSLLSFVNKYPDSYISASTIESYEGMLSLEDLKKSYDGLSEKCKGYKPGKVISEVIAKREAIVPGKPVPQFSRTDINGDIFNMSDLMGKVVLVDFWASWCKPCRAGMPHIKELYKKYHKKGLEVLCIADNDGDEPTWKQAIETDGTEDFIHLLRGLKRTSYGFDRSDDLSEMFTTHVLPTKFLVGTDGNFILTFASDKELDEKLKEIFGF